MIIINKTDNVNEGIIELIKVQKNLSYFEWKDDFEDEYDIINVPYNEILLDIINHLILYFQLLYYQEYQEHKLFEIFPIFHELKTLKVYFGIFFYFFYLLFFILKRYFINASFSPFF